MCVMCNLSTFAFTSLSYPCFYVVIVRILILCTKSNKSFGHTVTSYPLVFGENSDRGFITRSASELSSSPQYSAVDHNRASVWVFHKYHKTCLPVYSMSTIIGCWEWLPRCWYAVAKVFCVVVRSLLACQFKRPHTQVNDVLVDRYGNFSPILSSCLAINCQIIWYYVLELLTITQ